MCGRYSSTREPGDLAAEFEAEWDSTDDAIPASYNVAPTDSVYAVRVRHSEPVRALQVMRWGLVPSWADDPKIGNRMLNARAETLTTSGAFKRAAASRRCLVPADGWYEWLHKPDNPSKQAYFMTPPDGSEIAFAGLYEFWRRDDQRLVTCTVITTEAVGALADIHERMPLVLPPDRWEAWLDPERSDPKPLLEPATDLLESLELRPVGRAVGNVANNGPELQTRDEEPQPQALF